MLRLFPPWRCAWAKRGEQARVPITGRNARRVLQGTINLKTGHRILLRHPDRKHRNFGLYLRLLRRRYQSRPIWMVLDRDGSHTAPENLRLAQQLDIHLLWLPKQCSELNPMDQLWKEVKKDTAANRQYATIDEAADYAEAWIKHLTQGRSFKRRPCFQKSIGSIISENCQKLLAAYLGS